MLGFFFTQKAFNNSKKNEHFEDMSIQVCSKVYQLYLIPNSISHPSQTLSETTIHSKVSLTEGCVRKLDSQHLGYSCKWVKN